MTRGLDHENTHELVAFISGLSLDDENCNDVNMTMLAEFLVGELDLKISSRISRLVIAGNSLAPVEFLPAEEEEIDHTKSVSYLRSAAPFQLSSFEVSFIVEEPGSD